MQMGETHGFSVGQRLSFFGISQVSRIQEIPPETQFSIFSLNDDFGLKQKPDSRVSRPTRYAPWMF